MSILIYAKETPGELYPAHDWLTVGYRRRLGLNAVTPKMLARGLARTAPGKSAVYLGELLHTQMTRNGQEYGKLEWAQARVREATHGRALLTLAEIRALADALLKPAWRLYGGEDPGGVAEVFVYAVRITRPEANGDASVRVTGTSPSNAISSATAWAVSKDSGYVTETTDPKTLLGWQFEVTGSSRSIRPGVVTVGAS